MNAKRIKGLIKAGEVLTGIKGTDLLNMPQSTWYYRLARPESFRLDELEILSNAYGIRPTEFFEK